MMGLADELVPIVTLASESIRETFANPERTIRDASYVPAVEPSGTVRLPLQIPSLGDPDERDRVAGPRDSPLNEFSANCTELIAFSDLSPTLRERSWGRSSGASWVELISGP